jgi:hypothetical protein
MKNTADMTGGKPIAVLLQSISGVSAINPTVSFYDILGGIYFVPDTTRDYTHNKNIEKKWASIITLKIETGKG